MVLTIRLELIPTLDGIPLPIQFIEGVRYATHAGRLYPLAELIATLQHSPAADLGLALAPPPTRSPDRDHDIYRRVLGGMSMTKAGAPYGLSRQRVQQIIARLRSTPSA
jgi:hypothetical protein